MTAPPDILCIGSVLWDVIGRANASMRVGSDVPGRITRLPGGVALNIAMTLRKFGVHPALLTAVGRDPEGDELLRAVDRLGIGTEFVYRSDDLPTDRYMAVEGANGLIAAIADAHTLEAAGQKILGALYDGRLGTEDAPYSGIIALDGNLTVELLLDISRHAAFSKSDLRVAPASPGKALRLQPFLDRAMATLYVNLEEANHLTQGHHTSAEDAARALHDKGAARALVTNGGEMAAECGPDGLISAKPPEVLVTRVTGAGDTFMAAHVVAEMDGATPEAALNRALEAAAVYVSGDVPA